MGAGAPSGHSQAYSPALATVRRVTPCEGGCWATWLTVILSGVIRGGGLCPRVQSRQFHSQTCLTFPLSLSFSLYQGEWADPRACGPASHGGPGQRWPLSMPGVLQSHEASAAGRVVPLERWLGWASWWAPWALHERWPFAEGQGGVPRACALWSPTVLGLRPAFLQASDHSSFSEKERSSVWELVGNTRGQQSLVDTSVCPFLKETFRTPPNDPSQGPLVS